MKFRSWLSFFTVALSASMLVPSAQAQITRVGPTFVVNRLSNGNTTGVRYTDVAWDSVNHVYLVTWGAFGEVLGRFVLADGTVLGTDPFVITAPASGTDYKDAPKVAYSPDAAAFMVVWRDNRSNPNLPSAYGRSLRYVDTSGTPQFLGPDFLVTAAIVHSADNIVVSYATGSRQFLVVYNRGYDIRARLFDVNGGVIGTEIDIASTGDYEFQPNVTYNSNNDEFLVVWKWYSDPLFAGTVQARRVQAGSGTPLGGIINVDDLTGSDFAIPAAAFDPVGGKYLVGWYRFLGSFAFVGQMLNADGSLSGSRFTMAPTGNYVDFDIDFSTRMGRFFAVFAHHDLIDIYGVGVSPGGVPDSMAQVTVTAAVTGTDYGRVASATDRDEWLVTNNIWWSKATAQRVTYGGSAPAPSPGPTPTPPPPSATFSKQSPSTGSGGLGDPVTLQWGSVSGAGYRVCYDTTNNNSCDSVWWPNGGGTSRSLSGLAPGTYYWQARAETGSGATEADGGVWWSFTIGGAAPPPPPPTPTPSGVSGSINKLSPGSGVSGLGSTVTVQWSALAGAGYRVCWDTTNNNFCDTVWWPNGGGTSRGIEGLAPGTYYWQARAETGSGAADADSGVWWSFTVGGAAPPPPPSAPPPTSGGNGKLSPAFGVSGLGSTVTLQWAAVADAGYRVCWDTSNNNSCDSVWWPNGGGTSRNIVGLAPGTYYWQARAETGSGATEFDGGTWWSFTVGAAQPSGGGPAFGKASPGFGSSGTNSAVTVQWAAVANAGYSVCWDSSNNNSCDSAWMPNGAGTTRDLTGLAPGTYFWQVRAATSGGTAEADNGVWWSFTVGSAGAVSKLSPSSGTTITNGLVTMQWSALADAGYWVCWDTSNNNNCDSVWWPNGGGTVRQLSGLAPGTYYWQVRTQTGAGFGDGDGGTWWQFSVSAPTPMPETTALEGLVSAGATSAELVAVFDRDDVQFALEEDRRQPADRSRMSSNRILIGRQWSDARNLT